MTMMVVMMTIVGECGWVWIHYSLTSLMFPRDAATNWTCFTPPTIMEDNNDNGDGDYDNANDYHDDDYDDDTNMMVIWQWWILGNVEAHIALLCRNSQRWSCPTYQTRPLFFTKYGKSSFGPQFLMRQKVGSRFLGGNLFSFSCFMYSNIHGRL